MATVIDPGGETGSRRVGKSALCQLLGWSRPTLDLRLDTDQLFPVATRGVKGGGWAFDPAAVMAYLAGGASTSEGAAGTLCRAAGAKYSTAPVASGDPVMHAGEQNARQRRDAVNAEILEEKLQRDRGELVVAEDMRKVVTILQASINEGLDRLCRQIVTRLAISEAEAIMHELVNELRDAMAAELRPLFEQSQSRRSSPRPAVGQNTGSRR
jgi:phage terminase Nu1 subunit (DNA packaging protein)